MINKYNKEDIQNLSNSEIERLAILTEECGEVQQIIGKILRHGYKSYSPIDESKTTNRELLEKELGDIKWISELMIKNGDIDKDKIYKRTLDKGTNINNNFLHYNEKI